ncbi:hypothetical protein [Pseudolactococcus raffinolactis]|nr:hypothetical protein [Lactococcus raffinolactis]
MVRNLLILYQIGIVSEKQYENGKKSVDSLPNWNCFWETIRNR